MIRTKRTAALLLGVVFVLTLAATTVISARWIFKRVFAAYQKARAEDLQREETTQRELRNAFEKIIPPKNDVMTRSGAMLGLVSADYKSTLSWEQIKSHYSSSSVGRAGVTCSKIRSFTMGMITVVKK